MFRALVIGLGSFLLLALAAMGARNMGDLQLQERLSQLDLPAFPALPELPDALPQMASFNLFGPSDAEIAMQETLSTLETKVAELGFYAGLHDTRFNSTRSRFSTLEQQLEAERANLKDLDKAFVAFKNQALAQTEAKDGSVSQLRQTNQALRETITGLRAEISALRRDMAHHKTRQSATTRELTRDLNALKASVATSNGRPAPSSRTARFKQIVTEQLSIVDPSGKSRIRFNKSFDGNVEQVFYDKNGKRRLTFGIYPQQGKGQVARIRLLDGDGVIRMSQFVPDKEALAAPMPGPAFVLTDERGQPAYELKRDQTSRPASVVQSFYTAPGELRHYTFADAKRAAVQMLTPSGKLALSMLSGQVFGQSTTSSLRFDIAGDDTSLLFFDGDQELRTRLEPGGAFVYSDEARGNAVGIEATERHTRLLITRDGSSRAY